MYLNLFVHECKKCAIVLVYVCVRAARTFDLRFGTACDLHAQRVHVSVHVLQERLGRASRQRARLKYDKTRR